MFEASTGRLRYRKMFCWGTHQGGRRWQELLSAPGMAYLEIQAGLAPTQLHGLPMPARATWDWTQVFGALEVDPALAHGGDWTTAWQSVDRAIKARVAPDRIERIERGYRHFADQSASAAQSAGRRRALRIAGGGRARLAPPIAAIMAG